MTTFVVGMAGESLDSGHLVRQDKDGRWVRAPERRFRRWVRAGDGRVAWAETVGVVVLPADEGEPVEVAVWGDLSPSNSGEDMATITPRPFDDGELAELYGAAMRGRAQAADVVLLVFEVQRLRGELKAALESAEDKVCSECEGPRCGTCCHCPQCADPTTPSEHWRRRKG